MKSITITGGEREIGKILQENKRRIALGLIKIEGEAPPEKEVQTPKKDTKKPTPKKDTKKPELIPTKEVKTEE